jgi:hypothetical protein
MLPYNSIVLLFLCIVLFFMQWVKNSFFNESLLDALSVILLLWIIKKVKDEPKKDYTN